MNNSIEASEGKIEELRTSVEGKFIALSPKDVADLRPVSLFTKEEIEYMRQKLLKTKVNLELNEENEKSLSDLEFHARPDKIDLTQGRGPAVVAVLGEERAIDLINWSYNKAIDLGWKRHKIEGIDKTQGRGIQQAAADILSIVIYGYENQKSHLQKLRLRSWIGQRRAHVFSGVDEIMVIEKAFEDIPKPKKTRNFASLPPGSLLPLWQYLTVE